MAILTVAFVSRPSRRRRRSLRLGSPAVPPPPSPLSDASSFDRSRRVLCPSINLDALNMFAMSRALVMPRTVSVLRTLLTLSIDSSASKCLLLGGPLRRLMPFDGDWSLLVLISRVPKDARRGGVASAPLTSAGQSEATDEEHRSDGGGCVVSEECRRRSSEEFPAEGSCHSSLRSSPVPPGLRCLRTSTVDGRGFSVELRRRRRLILRSSSVIATDAGQQELTSQTAVGTTTGTPTSSRLSSGRPLSTATIRPLRLLVSFGVISEWQSSASLVTPSEFLLRKHRRPNDQQSEASVVFTDGEVLALRIFCILLLNRLKMRMYRKKVMTNGM